MFFMSCDVIMPTKVCSEFNSVKMASNANPEAVDPSGTHKFDACYTVTE